jgi:L-erythro-3,5-diaminohexanoate dehydrogenase
MHPKTHRAGDPLGLHRVITPVGVLPQAAERLDPEVPIFDNELLIDVDVLNIDAASFHQLRSTGKDVGEQIAAIVADRGKMHNPVTGSGGMLLGTVVDIGTGFDGDLAVGDRVATLVSLTLTPLRLHGIRAVHLDREQVEVEGHAILFESGLAARLPDDIAQGAVLAALDVAGAPAQVARVVKPGMTVGLMGTGKAGSLAAAAARRILGDTGRLIGFDINSGPLERLQEWGYLDDGRAVDATNPIAVRDAAMEMTEGIGCDCVISATSVPNTEMAAVLACKQGGSIIYFGMATSFTSAALGAEGLGRDVTMIIGNGYVPGHAKMAIELLRNEASLRDWFDQRWG